MSERSVAYIDIAALRHNVKRVKAYAPSAAILAMTKSNAYGHGLVEISRYLQEVDGFGVACLAEAIKLRDAGINKPIVLMPGFSDVADLRAIAEYDLQFVLHEMYQLAILEQTKLSKPIQAWIKIDTGMHRLGFHPQTFTAIYPRLIKNANLLQPMCLMTHLADADDRCKDTTTRQLQLFHEITKDLPGKKSVANSAGILAWPKTHFDWVRPGLMLYGVSPLVTTSASQLQLKPVMTLTSRLIAIHETEKGAAIGYGGAWICPEKMRVGVVAIGYGDGYPRHAKSGTPVLINGINCPLIGRVSMDMITVDLRPNPTAQNGDEVILWGKGLPAETIASFADTIAYELLCNVSQRVHFVYNEG